MIKHIVMFKLTDPTPETLTEACSRLTGMEGRVPQLRAIEVGVDTLRSQRSFDLALTTLFDSMDDLAAYQIHPLHVEVATYLRSVCSAVHTVDYPV